MRDDHRSTASLNPVGRHRIAPGGLSRRLSALAILSLSPSGADAAEIGGKQYRIEMPIASVEAPVESQERTPWGTAHAKTFHGTGVDGATTYHFTYFDFGTARPIDPSRLKQTVGYFLHHRKCTATALKQAPVPDAEGHAWPQVAWEGSCASGEVYRNLRTIAHGRLYEIGVSHPVGRSGADLDRALSVFASHCRFLRSTE